MTERRKRSDTKLVLREWGCGFEACFVVIFHSGRPAGRVRLIAFRQEMQRRMPDGTTATTSDGLAGSTPPGHTLSGTSGAIRFRPPSSPLQRLDLSRMTGPNYPANAGRTTGRATDRVPVGVSDVQIIPRSHRERVAQVRLSCHPCCRGSNKRNARRMPAGLQG